MPPFSPSMSMSSWATCIPYVRLRPNYVTNSKEAGLATGFNFLGADLRVSYQKLSDLVTWSVLSMGLGNLFWMPLALCFGKRPAVLVSMTMFLTGTIWSAVAKDYGSLLGSRIFASFGRSGYIDGSPANARRIRGE